MAVDLARIAESDPQLRVGVRALERGAGVKTLGDLMLLGEDADDVLRIALPRDERRAFCKAIAKKVRRLAETPLPSPAMPASDVPAGGAALDAWAERFGVLEDLDQPVRVPRNARHRKDLVFSLRSFVDLERFPHTGAKEGYSRASVRAAGLDVLAAAVKERAPLLAARAEFTRRRRTPDDAWLISRLALLEASVARMEAKVCQPTFLSRQHPNAAVTFTPRPPTLVIRMDRAAHIVSLVDGSVTNRGAHWHGTVERDELSLAILRCAVDILSDPASPVLKEILAWRATPAHEHLLSRFRSGLASARARMNEADEETRVAFRLLGNLTAPPQAVIQRARKGGAFSAGRKVWTMEALCVPGLTPQEREILETSALLEAGRFGIPGDAYRTKLRLFELLAEHPRVHLDDADKTAVRVRRTRPCLRVASTDDGFRLELAVGNVVPDLAQCELARNRMIVATDERQHLVSFAELDDATIALLSALRDHPSALSSGGLDAVLEVFTACPEVAVDLALPEEVQGEPVSADERLVIQLALAADGALALAVRVRPLPNGTAFVPGAPPRRAYGTAGGRRICATRDLDAEASRAERFLAELPLTGTDRHGPFDLRIDDSERACDVVAALGELADEVSIEWASGGRLRVARTLGTRSLKLRIERERDWFGVRGDADVDGAKVSLEALLAAVRAGRRSIPLKNGDLVAIDRELRARLQHADDLLHETRDGIVAAPPALAAVSDLVENENEQLVPAKEWLELRARVRSAAASEPALPPGLQTELRTYQLEGYRWLMRLAACSTGGCLADDMGLGKTLQSLAVLAARSDLGPALVVAPTSVCPNWLDEAARFTPGLACVTYRGAGRRQLLEWLGNGSVLVASYDLVLRDIEELAALRFATAIFDEAHALKNAYAKRVGAVRRLQADVRFALTDTPIENHTGELWSLFRIVTPGLFGPWERFRERFAGPIERDRDTARQTALATVVRPYLLRRTKAEVSPECLRVRRSCASSSSHRPNASSTKTSASARSQKRRRATTNVSRCSPR